MAMFGPASGQAATEAGDPNLLVGLAKLDDAAVYQVSPELAVVVTVDFFAPIVDDPYAYGAIAAANALSDVYAMGGDVTIALNIAGFPAEMDSEIVAEILRGGGEKVAEAGGIIAGGHTMIDAEPKYGLCALGVDDPGRILTKAGAQPGDVLYLTKSLGTGLIATAGDVDERDDAEDQLAVTVQRVRPVLGGEAVAVRAPDDLVFHVRALLLAERLVDLAVLHGVRLTAGLRVVDQRVHVLAQQRGGTLQPQHR